jgi:DNA primase
MGSIGDPFELILSKLLKKRRGGKGYIGLCPAHDDKRFSLSISRGNDDRVLLKCHAGCDIDRICEAFGIAKSDLFVNSGNGKTRLSDWDIVATYPYHDEAGQVVCEHVRYRNKVFHWRTPDGAANWRYGFYAAWYEQWNDGNWRAVKDKDKNTCCDPDKKPHADARWFDAFTDHHLYNEASIIETLPLSLVIFCEGEKDVHTGTKMDFISTTAGSANDWKSKYAPVFAALHLVIIPDNDSAGDTMAGRVAADCYEHAESIRILRLPDLPDHGDLTDWYEARIKEGRSNEEARELLRALINDTPLWEPELEGDEYTEKAIKEAKRAIIRAATQMNTESCDPLITEDKQKEEKLRSIAWDVARVVDTIMLLMAALGFEGNHHRIINALIAFAKKLHKPLTFFSASHAQLYAKYKRSKNIKDRSKTALVGADVAKLRAEMDALGYHVIHYIKGGILGLGTPDEQAYGSKFRLQILRYALITINLSDRVKGQFKNRNQADEWAVKQIAAMIPSRAPATKVVKKPDKMEARTDNGLHFDILKKGFLKAIRTEINRIVARKVAEVATVEELSEEVDTFTANLMNKINKITSEALCSGMAQLAEIERESEPSKHGLHVHAFMDVYEPCGESENPGSDVPHCREERTQSRIEEILTSMPLAESAPQSEAERRKQEIRCRWAEILQRAGCPFVDRSDSEEVIRLADELDELDQLASGAIPVDDFMYQAHGDAMEAIL